MASQRAVAANLLGGDWAATCVWAKPSEKTIIVQLRNSAFGLEYAVRVCCSFIV